MFDFSIITKYFNKLKKNHVLQKDNSYSKISTPPQISFNKKNKYNFDAKFNEYIYTFIALISKNPSINLKLFYENLRTLVISEKKNFNKLFFIKTHTKGQYDAFDNNILVMKDDNFYSIYHELLHCASSKITLTKMNVGFYKFVVSSKNGKILLNTGKSLNEGYTALLEKRYFDIIEHTQVRGYQIEKFISSLLEKIVTREEMEKLYFNADLDGLINYLKDFSKEEDIYLFLEYLDKVFVCSKKKISSKETQNIYKFIGTFLLKAYIYKLIYLFTKKSITRQEFEELFDSFIEELNIHFVTKNKNEYYFLTKDLTDKILDEVNDVLDMANYKKIRSRN